MRPTIHNECQGLLSKNELSIHSVTHPPLLGGTSAGSLPTFGLVSFWNESIWRFLGEGHEMWEQSPSEARLHLKPPAHAARFLAFVTSCKLRDYKPFIFG